MVTPIKEIGKDDVMRNMLLLIFLVISFMNCGGGYRTLKQYQSIVYYDDEINQFLIIEYNFSKNDTTWKSEYCKVPLKTSQILYVSIGDSISILKNHNILPDTTMKKIVENECYNVFRLYNNVDSSCSRYVSKPKSFNNFYHGPYTFVDLYLKNNIIKMIKFLLLAT